LSFAATPALFPKTTVSAYLGLCFSLYVGVVALVSAVMNWLVTPDGLVIDMSRADIVFAVVICVCTILMFGINDSMRPARRIGAHVELDRQRHPVGERR
jgi:hypothetical protein